MFLSKIGCFSLFFLGAVSGYATIVEEELPYLGEDMIQDSSDGENVPSQEEVQASRPQVEYDALDGQEQIETPEGEESVPVFGVSPE